MTMTDLKPHAVTEFNLYVTDEFAREYFEDSFDLWARNGKQVHRRQQRL